MLHEVVCAIRKDESHMSIALSGKLMFVLFLLVLVTVFVFGLMLLSTVAHVNIWHVLPSAKVFMYGGD